MKPRLYPRLAIAACAVLFSPIFGGFLFALNMNQADRSRDSLLVFIGGFVWVMLGHLLVYLLGGDDARLQWILTNISGGWVLYYPLWYAYLSDVHDYEIRNIWKPVSWILGLIGLFILMMIILHFWYFGGRH